MEIRTPVSQLITNFRSEREAILDTAQAEKRNITTEEEQNYLKLAQLEGIADLIKEMDEDD